MYEFRPTRSLQFGARADDISPYGKPETSHRPLPMPFVPEHFLSLLPVVDRTIADAQEFGVIRVDDTGLITLYNRWESDMAGVQISAAEGRNFFTQVAPCTNNRLVFGRFRDGLSKGDLDSELDYTFTYKMKPTNVRLHLYRHVASATNWIFVQRRTS